MKTPRNRNSGELPEHAGTPGQLPLPPELKLHMVFVLVNLLKASNRPLRRRSSKLIDKLVRSIEVYGFVRPILIDEFNHIIDGEAVVEAARELGLEKVPAIVVDHLSPVKLKALRLALNRLQEESEWDLSALRHEFETILELDEALELDLTGFEMGEIDHVMSLEEDSSGKQEPDEADRLPEASGGPPVSRPGDRFILGKHVLYCGDATLLEIYRAALKNSVADLVFTDPPYNVRIGGHVSGMGRMKHREFAVASGEMSREGFGEFLDRFIAQTVDHCRQGAVIFCCMDWRSYDLLAARLRANGLELLNLCVWAKSNGGMGSLYRSRHELIAVARKGEASHINNVQLGKYGRNRTNVWEYAGMNSFGRNRLEQLHSHPTVKPVALIRDAIMDCSNRGDLVLDPFGGSGSTMIAAEKAGRRSCLIELDPVYVDLIIRRFRDQFGVEAVHDATGLTFSELAEQRRGEPQNPGSENGEPARDVDTLDSVAGDQSRSSSGTASPARVTPMGTRRPPPTNAPAVPGQRTSAQAATKARRRPPPQQTRRPPPQTGTSRPRPQASTKPARPRTARKG